jgi:hypothetical protein
LIGEFIPLLTQSGTSLLFLDWFTQFLFDWLFLFHGPVTKALEPDLTTEARVMLSSSEESMELLSSLKIHKH